MNCRVNEEQLASWVMGVATKDEAINLTEHIKHCFQCSKKIEELKHSYDFLNQSEHRKVPEELIQRIMVRAKEKKQSIRSYWSMWKLGVIVSTTAIILTFGTMLFYPKSQLDHTELYKNYNEDFKTLGFYYENSDDQDSNGIVGVPTELISYLN